LLQAAAVRASAKARTTRMPRPPPRSGRGVAGMSREYSRDGLCAAYSAVRCPRSPSEENAMRRSSGRLSPALLLALTVVVAAAVTVVTAQERPPIRIGVMND